MEYDIKKVREGNHIKYLMHRNDRWKWNSYDGIDIKKNFRIEYVDNPKVWDNIVTEKYDNSWEHYKIKEFEALWDAMEFYIFRLFDTKTFDVKMWCETILDGKIVLEETMEFYRSFPHEFRKFLDRENTIMRDKALDALEPIQKENEMMKSFIKKYHAEENYKEFVKRMEKTSIDNRKEDD